MNLKSINSIKILFVFFFIFFKTSTCFSQSSRTTSFGSLKKDTLLFQNKMGIKDNLVQDDIFIQNNIDRYPVNKLYTDYQNWLNENKIQNKFGTMNIIGDVSKFLIVKKLKSNPTTFLTSIETTKLSTGLQAETPAWDSSGYALVNEGIVNVRSIFMRNLFESFSSSIVINEDNIGAYLGFDSGLNPYFGTTLNITSLSPNKINIAEKMIIGPTYVLIGKSSPTIGTNGSLEIADGSVSARKIYGFYGFSEQVVNAGLNITFQFPDDTNLNYFVINGTSSALTSGNAVGSGAMRARNSLYVVTPGLMAELSFTYKESCSLAIFTCFELFSVYESIFYSTQIVVTDSSGTPIGLESEINTHQFEDHNWYDEGYDYTLINQLAYDPATNKLTKDRTYKIRLYAWVSAVEKISRTTFKHASTHSQQCRYMGDYPFSPKFASIALLGLPTP